MTIKSWIVSPLAHLSTSSKWISVVEQRQYLYNQERQLEKSVRYQEWISESIQSLMNSRESQIHAIVNYQNDQQSNYTGVLEDISWGINTLGFKVDQGTRMVSLWLMEINITQLLWLQKLWKMDQTLRNGFDGMLKSLEMQTIIFIRISSQIGKIIETLQNPRKIEGLEYKRDAINYLQNKWFVEALEYLHLASTKLTSDQDVYYLMWVIEFEENKNYEIAIENFEKAIKYAKGYQDMQIYLQALAKLASIYFILDWADGATDKSKIQKAYDYQLDAVVASNQESNYIFDLLKYSVILSQYETFAEYLYIFLKNNPHAIADITSYSLFLADKKVIKIINTVIAKIVEADQVEKHRLEKEKAEEAKELEKKENARLDYDKYRTITSWFRDSKKDISELIDLEISFWPFAHWVNRFLSNGFAFATQNDPYKLTKYQWNEVVLTKDGRSSSAFQRVSIDWPFAIWTKNSSEDFLLNSNLKILASWGFVNYIKGSYIVNSNLLVLDDETIISVRQFSHMQLSHFDYDKWYAILIVDSKSIRKIYKNWKQSEYEWINEKQYPDKSLIIKSFNKDIRDRVYNNVDSSIGDPVFAKDSKRSSHVNFIKADGTYLFYSSKFPELQKKFQNMDLLVSQFLVSDFDNAGKWMLKIGSETYSIQRIKNNFWFYTYTFWF